MLSIFLTPRVSRWLGSGLGGPRVVGAFFVCLVLAEIGVFVAFAVQPPPPLENAQRDAEKVA